MARMVLPVPGRAVERHDADLGVEQQLKRELLLLGAGPQPPRLRGPQQRLEATTGAAGEHRLAATAQHREVVAGELVGVGEPRRLVAVDHGREHVGHVDATVVVVEPVDQGRLDLDGAPARGLPVVEAPPPVVLGGLEAQLGRLDAQRGVVRHDHGGPVAGLAEGRRQDAVVGLVGVEPAGRHLGGVQPVGLDAERAAVGEGHGRADVAAVVDPQVLDAPDHLPGRPAHVVGPRLVLVELLDDHQGDHRVVTGEGVDRLRIGDEHRRVEHDPGGGEHERAVGARRGSEQVGHEVSLGVVGGWGGTGREESAPKGVRAAGRCLDGRSAGLRRESGAHRITGGLVEANVRRVRDACRCPSHLMGRPRWGMVVAAASAHVEQPDAPVDVSARGAR